mgnify:CR=1 FL=1|jgi:hypothetical protein
MKKPYESPEIEITDFKIEETITLDESGGGDYDVLIIFMSFWKRTSLYT